VEFKITKEVRDPQSRTLTTLSPPTTPIAAPALAGAPRPPPSATTLQRTTLDALGKHQRAVKRASKKQKMVEGWVNIKLDEETE
jgi:hypothetical protein